MDRWDKAFEEMMGFEKWLYYFQDKDGRVYTPTLSRYGTVEEEETAEEIWRAALEWAKDQETGTYGSLESLLYKIDEELNAKT